MQRADDVPQGRLGRGLFHEDSLSQRDRLIEIHILALLKIGVAVGIAYAERRVLFGMMHAKITETQSAPIAPPGVTEITVAAVPRITAKIAAHVAGRESIGDKMLRR